MAKRSRPLGPLLAIGVLTLLICVGVVYVYVGWAPLVGEPGFVMTGTGYVAMAIGLMAAVVLGIGLAALILSGRRKD
jgi:hypothetical protein